MLSPWRWQRGAPLIPNASAHRVVMVSRDFPLLEGGNGAVLLAGLSLPADVQVTEVLGGAPAVLDQLVAGDAGTLVIAADDSEHAAGAAAALLGRLAAPPSHLSPGGMAASHLGAWPGRRPPHLCRSSAATRGRCEIDAGPPRPRRLTGGCGGCGVKAKELGLGFDTVARSGRLEHSAAAVIRLIAAAMESRSDGLVIAIEQSMVTIAYLTNTVTAPAVSRDETLVA